MKKILKPSVILAAFALALAACSPADQTYDKNGISFDYPGDWTITEDEFADSRGYLSLEKNESIPKATVTFGWLAMDTEIGADMMLSGILREMQMFEKLTDLVSTPAEDATYGPYPARAITYTATADGVPVSGAVWVFKADGRIVNVAVREGADKANLEAFKTVRESFTLK